MQSEKSYSHGIKTSCYAFMPFLKLFRIAFCTRLSQIIELMHSLRRSLFCSDASSLCERLYGSSSSLFRRTISFQTDVIMLRSSSVIISKTTSHAKDLTNFHKISETTKFRCRFDVSPVNVCLN